VSYRGCTMALEEHVYRLSTTEYERMVESGVLEGTHVELLDGLLVDMGQQSPLHAALIMRLVQLSASRVELLRIQMPLDAVDGWMPEPDVALVDGKPSVEHHPHTALLAVEVSCSTQAIDRRKALAYAAAGVPRYWLVDVPKARVFEYTEPGPDGYEIVMPLAGDDVLDARVDGVATTTVAQLLAF
jgi:Uma2 family endonuclease